MEPTIHVFFQRYLFPSQDILHVVSTAKGPGPGDHQDYDQLINRFLVNIPAEHGKIGNQEPAIGEKLQIFYILYLFAHPEQSRQKSGTARVNICRPDSHTGLGLHIVKKAMESYGGYAYVEDNEPKGAVFVMRFRMVT